MSPTTITLEISSPEQEALVRQFHALVQELEQLALSAPAGQVLDRCEAAVQQRGRQLLLESGWSGVCQRVGEEYEKGDTPERTALEKRTGYFAKHLQRLKYRERLAAGQAIGSGSVEGWATTLGLRLKARGGRWCRGNGPGMSALIGVRNSSQWSAYWSAAA